MRTLIALIVGILLTSSALAYTGGGGVFFLSSRLVNQKNIAQHISISGVEEYRFSCGNADSVDEGTGYRFVTQECLKGVVVSGIIAEYGAPIRLAYVDIYTILGQSSVEKTAGFQADKLVRVSPKFMPGEFIVVVRLPRYSSFDTYRREYSDNRWSDWMSESLEFVRSDFAYNYYRTTVSEDTYLAFRQR